MPKDTNEREEMDKMSEIEKKENPKEKVSFSNELAYVVGMLTVALGVAFMEKANFGVSMVVAPAYLLYLKLSETYSFFTFGMAEYTLQAILLIIMVIVLRKFKISYLFSFVTAVLYGFTLDVCMVLIKGIDTQPLWVRIVLFLSGMFLCSIGISLFFHSYISPEAYELFVKEVSHHIGMDINKFKTIYDCTSCLISIVMSFAFFGFGHFEGVKLGTVFCALINGSLIGAVSRFLEKRFEFKDSLNSNVRKFFER